MFLRVFCRTKFVILAFISTVLFMKLLTAQVNDQKFFLGACLLLAAFFLTHLEIREEIAREKLSNVIDQIRNYVFILITMSFEYDMERIMKQAAQRVISMEKEKNSGNAKKALAEAEEYRALLWAYIMHPERHFKKRESGNITIRFIFD